MSQDSGIGSLPGFAPDSLWRDSSRDANSRPKFRFPRSLKVPCQDVLPREKVPTPRAQPGLSPFWTRDYFPLPGQSQAKPKGDVPGLGLLNLARGILEIAPHRRSAPREFAPRWSVPGNCRIRPKGPRDWRPKGEVPGNCA